MSDVTKVLDLLRRNLGLGETPDGSNNNHIVQWYNRHVSRIGNGPWCEMTISWAMHMSGFAHLKSPNAWTVQACRDAIAGNRGQRFIYGTKGLRAGDQVYYDWSQRKGDVTYVDHTGMVEKVNSNGTFYVIEGNVRNRLVRVLRDAKYVVGYIRFAWESSPPTKQPKLPKPKKTAAMRKRIRRFQRLLRLPQSGVWYSSTDIVAIRTRNAAKTYTNNQTTARFAISRVQRTIGTKDDGIWGPKSQIAMVRWTKRVQRFFKVDDDGIWGPETDLAFLQFRAAST